MWLLEKTIALFKRTAPVKSETLPPRKNKIGDVLIRGTHLVVWQSNHGPRLKGSADFIEFIYEKYNLRINPCTFSNFLRGRYSVPDPTAYKDFAVLVKEAPEIVDIVAFFNEEVAV